MADISTHSTLTTGLISYYDLNDATASSIWDDAHSTNDLSNNSNSTGVTSVSGINGQNAASFEETDEEWLSITDASQANMDITGDFSFSTFISWESLPATTEHMPIFSKWEVTAGGRGYMANLYNPSGTTRLQLSVSSDGTINDSIQIDFTPTLDQVYHVVATYDASSADTKYYVDGSQHGTTQDMGINSVHDNSIDFRIGAWHTPHEWHDGTQQFFGLWNKVLTTSEITDLYNSGSGLMYTNPTGSISNISSLTGISSLTI